ncbi:MAG TPA: SDR family NAD(P)-dependent oxidoreductase [Candidatus Nanoarchaeia archaeon]|nr:SDR family NAD(P)-dependent oxidoreductase [Candidatus Nanoarchaeia archaeon]
MNVLITGGAGFIGRWTAKKFLDERNKVTVIDNLSNGREENIKEFRKNRNFKFTMADITNNVELSRIFAEKFDLIVHLAAQIEVQQSISNPKKPFENNVIGTYNLLEEAKKEKTKIVIIGTCMVYDFANAKKPINEEHPTIPKSPYAGSKLAAENIAESYYHGLGLPVVILRPFNTYGAFQKTNMEGGVVSIFIKNELEGKELSIFGDGEQTRDLLYVEDCAEFIYKASTSEKAVGQTLNAGTGRDITINKLAEIICSDRKRIVHVPHHHPQAEIKKLQCDYSKAKKLLGWMPKTSLEEGIRKTREWIKKND